MTSVNGVSVPRLVLTCVLALVVLYSFIAISCYSERIGEGSSLSCRRLFPNQRYPVFSVSIGTFVVGFLSYIYLTFAERILRDFNASVGLWRGDLGVQDNQSATINASWRRAQNRVERAVFYALGFASIFVVPVLPLIIDAFKDTGDWNNFSRRIPNMTGVAAATSMAWFMIPVAHQSPMLLALRWNPTDALTLHIWAGRVCFFFSMVHSVTEILVFRRLIYADRSWKDMLQYYLQLPKACWSLKSDRPRRDVLKSMTAFDLGNSCLIRVINWTGTMTALALVLIVALSANWIRRRYYAFFLQSHIVLSWLFLVLLVVHLQNLVLYVLPPLLYYWACTSLTLVELIATWFSGGHKAQHCRFLEDANGCYELCMETDISRIHCSTVARPRFVRILCPSISLTSHPFTVIDDNTLETRTVEDAQDNRTSSLRILIRPLGSFTKELAHRLNKSQPPILLLDGLYGGEDWVSECLLRENVLLVAGGVGISPFLSVLPCLYTTVETGGTPALPVTVTRRVVLHWSCREHGLIRHVISNYFEPLTQCKMKRQNDQATFSVTLDGGNLSLLPEMSLESASSPRCIFEIHIHNTSQGAASVDVIEAQRILNWTCPSEDDVRYFESTSSTHSHPKPFSPPILGADHCTQGNLIRGLVPTFLFVVTFGVGILAEEYHAKNDAKSSEWVRLLYLLGVIAFVVFIFIGATCLSKLQLHFGLMKWRAVPSSDVVTSNREIAKREKDRSEAQNINQLPFEFEGVSTLMSIRQSRGRPRASEMCSFLESDSNEAAAIFMCGPVEMMASIKRELKYKANCSIFEEKYEL